MSLEQTHYTQAHDMAAASACDVLASTADALARSLALRGNPIADEFLALSERLMSRGDVLRGDDPIPGTPPRVRHLHLMP
jgi:hypothetical protein